MRGMAWLCPSYKTTKSTKSTKSRSGINDLDALDVSDALDVLKERLKCGIDGCITRQVFPAGCDLASVRVGSIEALQGLVHALRI